MAQQSSSHVSSLPPARVSGGETIVDTKSSSVLVHQYPKARIHLTASAEIISHKIDKIIKKNSIEYFCNTCNTLYSRLSWTIEDHPDFDVKNFNVINIAKPQEVLIL